MSNPSDHHLPDLFSLPQAILDHIFTVSYPPIPNLRLITLSTWHARSLHRQNRSSTPSILSDPKVNDFLISKRYFLLASKAWISNQTFSDLDFVQSAKYIGNQREERKLGGIFFSFAKRFRLKSRHLPCICDFPSLEEAIIDVDDDVFAGSKPREAWKEVFAEEELVSLAFFAALLNQGKRLKSVVLLPAPCVYALGDEEEKIWRRNIRRLEGLINERLSSTERRKQGMNKESTSQSNHSHENGQKSLYTGSKVYLKNDTTSLAKATEAPATLASFPPQRATTWPPASVLLKQPKSNLFQTCAGEETERPAAQSTLAQEKPIKTSSQRTPREVQLSQIMEEGRHDLDSAKTKVEQEPAHRKIATEPLFADEVDQKSTLTTHREIEQNSAAVEANLRDTRTETGEDRTGPQNERETKKSEQGSVAIALLSPEEEQEKQTGDEPEDEHAAQITLSHEKGEPAESEDHSRLLELLSSGGMVALLGLVYYAANAV